MVVGFTTICAISVYHRDEVCQWLATDQWFYSDTPVSSTNKTDRHDITDIVLKIRVITKLPNSEQSYKGKVKTHNYINRQNQSTYGKLWKPQWPWLGTDISKEMVGWIRF